MDKQVDNNTKQIEKIDYKSGEIFLDICRREYESEKNRVNTIDSKTNIVITLLSVFFVSMTEVINFKSIFLYPVSNFFESIFPTFLLITMLGAIITSFISILCFLKVIFTSSYKCIDLQYFYNIDQLKNEKELYSITLAHFYIEATEANRNANDKRIQIYKKGRLCQEKCVRIFEKLITQCFYQPRGTPRLVKTVVKSYARIFQYGL